MTIFRAFVLLIALQCFSVAMAIDFNKNSTSVAGAMSNDVFMQALTKEKLLDAVCEKADVIKRTKTADAKRQLIMLDSPMVSGGRLVTPNEPMMMMPPIVTGGVYATAFFNSYGLELKNDKNCADAPYRIQDGIAAFIRYYIEKTPENENNALSVVESAKKIPLVCRDKVLDYLNYADKRLDKCIP